MKTLIHKKLDWAWFMGVVVILDGFANVRLYPRPAPKQTMFNVGTDLPYPFRHMLNGGFGIALNF